MDGTCLVAPIPYFVFLLLKVLVLLTAQYSDFTPKMSNFSSASLQTCNEFVSTRPGAASSHVRVEALRR